MLDRERQELLMSDFMQVPNIILQMQKVLKNGNTYACLQFIWSKTGGWGRNEDTIAYSQFANDKRYGTGLSIKTIQRSVEKLSELGVITITPSFNNMHEFTLNIEKIRELVGEQAKSNSPSLEDTSQVNLSVSQVNLSASQDYLSDKPSQIDLHTITTTQEPLHKNLTQEEKPVSCEAEKLVDLWNENRPSNAQVKTSVWVKKVKTRLKTFTADEIKQAMLFLINDHWYQSNSQVLIKNVIDSDERCAKALEKSSQPVKTNYQGNNNGSHQSANNRPQRETQAEYEQRMQREFNQEFGMEVQAGSSADSYS